MRFFIENFEETYNREWPFGRHPAFDWYPSTGTHIGSDFRVDNNTAIIAPADGEMYKVFVSDYKGNVGVYIFEYEGTTWGLELCHLKELPKLGKCVTGDIIARSGNTGSKSTGPHLHAVLHLNATVTKNYSELKSREAFLQLQKDGRLIDCFAWFCANIQKENQKKKVASDSTMKNKQETTPDNKQPVQTPIPQSGWKQLWASFLEYVKKIIE